MLTYLKFGDNYNIGDAGKVALRGAALPTLSLVL